MPSPPPSIVPSDPGLRVSVHEDEGHTPVGRPDGFVSPAPLGYPEAPFPALPPAMNDDRDLAETHELEPNGQPSPPLAPWRSFMGMPLRKPRWADGAWVVGMVLIVGGLLAAGIHLRGGSVPNAMILAGGIGLGVGLHRLGARFRDDTAMRAFLLLLILVAIWGAAVLGVARLTGHL